MSKISFSAYKKYLACPQMYKYHYVDKLRSPITTSALLFGSAVDEALNAMLEGKSNYTEVFQDNFKYEEMANVLWDKSDFDESVFTPEQKKKVSGHKNLEYTAWASLRVKGRMMLDAYKDQILPNMMHVYTVQGMLTGRRGFIDVIADYDDYGKVLLDNKTSKSPYKSNALDADIQLHLYAQDQGIDKIGYIVLNKGLTQNKKCLKCGVKCYSSHRTCPQDVSGKRCHGKFETDPQVNIQVMIGNVDPDKTRLIEESITNVETMIQNDTFYRDLTQCRGYYGKDCIYLNKCLHNQDKGLIIEPTKEKK